MKRRWVTSALGGTVLVLLSGCGFHPLYGSTTQGSTVEDQLSAVVVPSPSGRLEQLIRNDLVSNLHPAGVQSAGSYRLTITPSGDTSTGITYPVPSTTRYSYRLSVTYELTDSATGKVLTSGTSRSFVSYDKQKQPFANIQASSDAENRAVREVSNDIRLRLAAYFSRS
jgi:LPS-assembly lipoprotein